MRSGRGTLRLTLAAVLLHLVGASLLCADWLVTRDGQQIETRGAWEIRGKAVIFTLPNGTLGSMRVKEVDLEASRALEESLAAKHVAPSEEMEEKTPVLVVTDADMSPRALRRGPEDSDSPGEVSDAAPSPAAPISAVAVAQWERVDEPGELDFEISGTVRNGGSDMALDLKVSISLFDENGQSLVTTIAKVTKDTLVPGESTEFTAGFDSQVSDYDRVEFDVTSYDVVMKRPEPTEEQEN